jgi:hypothetical protein
MIVIKKIDSYKDGGTIFVECLVTSAGALNLHFDVVEICLDKRMRGKGTNKLWLGYPGKPDSEIITDEDFIDKFINVLKDHKKYMNYKIDDILDSVK